MIDAALAFTGHGVDPGFQGRHDQTTFRDRLGTVPHRLVPSRGSTGHRALRRHRRELRVPHRQWRLGLVATSNTLDQPFLFTLAPGDPSNPRTWLHWSTGRELMIPSQAFNTGPGISSVASNTPTRPSSVSGPKGEDYLTYAGSTELKAYGGWGHARIGIARSSDLVHWRFHLAEGPWRAGRRSSAVNLSRADGVMVQAASSSTYPTRDRNNPPSATDSRDARRNGIECIRQRNASNDRSRLKTFASRRIECSPVVSTSFAVPSALAAKSLAPFEEDLYEVRSSTFASFGRRVAHCRGAQRYRHCRIISACNQLRQAQ